MKPIALFTLPNCKWCKEAIIYLKSKKLRFNQIDLSKDKNALKDCQKRCSGAPVILVGNTWICGFDKNKLNKELGIK
jgi:glutaredoxin 3